MKKQPTIIRNNKLLNSENHEIWQDSMVGDFVDAISINQTFTNSGDVSSASSSLNKVLAFVEYGLSFHHSGPQCPNETIYEGAAEIIRACRLVSLRIEEGVWKIHRD